jgi:hypothetical protein
MSRRRPVTTGPAVSLFPFLAVLMCTMGALLVLLVLFSRAAEEGDEAQANAVNRARAEELELARDEFAWRLEQLAGIHAQTTADLARARLQLAGIEDDSRTLADEFERLDETIAALEADAAAPADPDASVADLEARLADARARLEATRREGAARPPAYAVVPYEGSHGTRRRPLYIECCIDGVFLQPEGIRFGPADFEGPAGPGNPLACALRAAREHIAMNGGGTDPDAQPYPLILVRPSGVMAYYAAREAIQSWGNEFGYQFIDEDWQIAYPPVDPTLAAAELRAVEESRRRLEWLAQVRPPQPTRPTQQYRAATTRGGVVAEGGPTVLGDRSRFDWKEDPSSRGRAGGDTATASALGTGGGPGGGIGDSGSGGGALGAGSGPAGGQGFGPAAPGAYGTGTALASAAGGGPAPATVAGGVGDRYAGPSRFYSGLPGDGGGSMAGGDGGSSGSSLAAAGTAGGGGETGSGADRTGTDGPGGGAAGTAGAGGAAGGTGTAATGAAANATGGGGGGPSMPGLAGASMQQQAGGASGASASISLAGRRGSNWASLATEDRPVPLTRPIRLECAADEFRVLGDDGRVEERIAIGSRTIDAVDPLVQAVHAKVGRWGIAGDRMYWRPQLVLSATPDGGARRDELEALLADSGLDTRRSEGVEPVRPLPPVRRPRGLFSSRSP